MVLSYHYENLEKHSVTPDEVDECLADSGKVIVKKKGALFIIGKTFSGRLLEVGINKENFVYHAMDASKFFYRHYKGKNKR